MTDHMHTVQGRCPACRGASLFLGDGGHVTCARLDCPNPTAADELLHGEPHTPSVQIHIQPDPPHVAEAIRDIRRHGTPPHGRA